MICPSCGRPHTEHITARDMQILELMRSGMGSAEIADSLGLEPGPLSRWIHRVYRIVGAENRREFAAAFKIRQP